MSELKDNLSDNLRDNLSEVESRVLKACERAGRDRKDVTLIAVSKTKPSSMIEEFYSLGVRDFGENKVQEMCDKMEILPKDIRWHMIGHLQTNKVKYIVGKVYMIHSVDTLHLAEAISKEAVKKSVNVRITVEINVGEEASKFGEGLDKASDLVNSIRLLPNLSVVGLMCIAPFVEDAELNREHFKNLKNMASSLGLSELSMGMSGDFEVAIEEGSTFVRVGTSLFGKRDYAV